MKTMSANKINKLIVVVALLMFTFFNTNIIINAYLYACIYIYVHKYCEKNQEIYDTEKIDDWQEWWFSLHTYLHLYKYRSMFCILYFKSDVYGLYGALQVMRLYF